MFLGVDRDKTGRIGFLGSSGGRSGFDLKIGDCPDEIGTVGKYAIPSKAHNILDFFGAF